MEDIEQPATTYGVIVTKSGEQIPYTAPEGVVMGAFSIGDPMVSNARLNVTQEEFDVIQEQATTNSVPDDTIKTKAITD